MNKLYLVKMGMNYKNEGDMKGSDIGNYRIRGTFHDKNNDLIFVEFGNGMAFDKKNKITSRIKLRIDHQYNRTISDDENISHIKIDYNELDQYFYTKQDILKYINKHFGTNFEQLILIDTTITDYDYNKIAGDNYEEDEKTTKQCQKIKDYFYNFEKEVEHKKYPNLSTYFEDGIFTVLKHYNGFNDKIKIENVYNFKFNYNISCESEVK